jgi:hypothetical protein
MREIDLLLEGSPMRRNVEANRTAVIAQTVCLTAVGLFFFVAFFYALTHQELSNQPSHTEIGYFGIPQR